MKQLNCLLGCEESQAITIELDKLGHFVHSCDLQDCSGGRPDLHIKADIFHTLHSTRYTSGLNLFICHPSCQFLANSGVRWLASVTERPGFVWSEKYNIFINTERFEKMTDAALFFRSLLYTNCDGLCLENPIMHKYAMEIIGVKPTQVIHPWQFGHGETKATCLWLKGLPALIPTDIVEGREGKVWKMAPGPERTKLRSKTYAGIAKAIAQQFSSYLINKQ